MADECELLDMWGRDQARRGVMASSRQTRGARVRAFRAWMLPRSMFDATEEDVQTFLDERRTHMGDPIGLRTRCGYLSALHCFYRWAVRVGMTDHTPTGDIDRPKLPRNLPRPIGDDDLATAIRCAPDQIERWLILAAYAGLRCCEIAGLKRDDILWDVGLLHIKGKGGKERMVPMHAKVVDALSTWPMPPVNCAIFRRPQGGSWPSSHLSSTGGRYFRSIGVNASMHQLRHWFGTRTYRACKDIRVVQELMGHADPSTTAIYTAWGMEDATNAVDALV